MKISLSARSSRSARRQIHLLTGLKEVWWGAPAQAQFEVLSLEKLRDRQAEALQQTATVTMLPDDEATRVLRHFNW